MGKALRSLGVDVLIIEKASRAGNSWRTRYHEEFIRYPKAALHFPSLELPHDWSDRITPIMMADWIEGYASIMGIEVVSIVLLMLKHLSPQLMVKPQVDTIRNIPLLYKIR